MDQWDSVMDFICGHGRLKSADCRMDHQHVVVVEFLYGVLFLPLLGILLFDAMGSGFQICPFMISVQCKQKIKKSRFKMTVILYLVLTSLIFTK